MRLIFSLCFSLLSLVSALDEVALTPTDYTDSVRYKVAISDDYLVVGAASIDKVSVFVLDDNSDWEEVQVIEPPTTPIKFGQCVSTYDDVIVVGAPDYETGQGAIFVYHFTGSRFEEAAILTNAAETAMGNSVYIYKDVISSSSVGSNYVLMFRRVTKDDWEFSEKLTVSTNLSTVYLNTIYERTMITGNTNEVDGQFVHVFKRSAPDFWTETARLTSDDTVPNDYYGYGWSTHVSGHLAIVAAPGHNSAKGAVYVYKNHGFDLWSQAAKLVAPDEQNSDYFGASVYANRCVLVASATYRDSGTMHFFDTCRGFDHVDEFESTVYADGSERGKYLALSKETLVVTGAVSTAYQPSVITGFSNNHPDGESLSNDQYLGIACAIVFGGSFVLIVAALGVKKHMASPDK